MAAIDDIQQALNVIRQHADEADWQTRLEALELMLSVSQSVVSRARQLTEPKTKTRTVAVPKTKIVPRQANTQPTKKPVQKTPEPRSLEPVKPVPPLSNQQRL